MRLQRPPYHSALIPGTRVGGVTEFDLAAAKKKNAASLRKIKES
jgi:hypothetical protein